jgi:hypothetical protein
MILSQPSLNSMTAKLALSALASRSEAVVELPVASRPEGPDWDPKGRVLKVTVESSIAMISSFSRATFTVAAIQKLGVWRLRRVGNHGSLLCSVLSKTRRGVGRFIGAPRPGPPCPAAEVGRWVP